MQFTLILTTLFATAFATPTDILNLVNVKRVPVSVLSEGNTSADNIQVTSVKQDFRRRGWGNNAVVREATRPYEEDVVEALLASLALGHDFEE